MTSFQLPTGAPGARILAFGHYQPSNVVTNDDLAKTVETNDEWIQSRVGISAEKGDPLGAMVLSSRARAQAVQRDATALLTACGLALRSFD